jgi:hypothetical protein
MSKWKKIVLLLNIFAFFSANLMGQCVMCKAQAEAQWEEDGSGINMGIIYIMVIPYIILFIVFRKQIRGFFRNWKNMN